MLIHPEIFDANSQLTECGAPFNDALRELNVYLLKMLSYSPYPDVDLFGGRFQHACQVVRLEPAALGGRQPTSALVGEPFARQQQQQIEIGPVSEDMPPPAENERELDVLFARIDLESHSNADATDQRRLCLVSVLAERKLKSPSIGFELNCLTVLDCADLTVALQEPFAAFARQIRFGVDLARRKQAERSEVYLYSLTGYGPRSRGPCLGQSPLITLGTETQDGALLNGGAPLHGNAVQDGSVLGRQVTNSPCAVKEHHGVLARRPCRSQNKVAMGAAPYEAPGRRPDAPASPQVEKNGHPRIVIHGALGGVILKIRHRTEKVAAPSGFRSVLIDRRRPSLSAKGASISRLRGREPGGFRDRFS